jgi:uncharacterized protein YndB with AHSA1/START domain
VARAPGLAAACTLVLAATLVASRAQAADRMLRTEILVPAPVSEVWEAWTTAKGIESFFAPKAKVDLRVDGTYDVLFLPDKQPGHRGAEGMRILDIEKEKRFAFTWNAPVSFPTLREKRTMVILDFAAEGEKTTRLRFTQVGWGEGKDWDAAYDYFDQAWGQYVLPLLVRRFAVGPIDWKHPPKPDPKWASLKRSLQPVQS